MDKYIANEASVCEQVVIKNLLKENEELVTVFKELKQYYHLK